MLFGAKSERFVAANPNQLTLFELPEPQKPEPQTQQINYTRTKAGQKNKQQPLRLELPAHLPRKQQVIEPQNLPEGARFIGNAITEVLEYEPGSIYVRQIVRPKYVLGQNQEQTQIAIAELPSLPIEKGNAGASMLAHLIVSKYADHLPFYRQVQMFKRQKLQLSESTINGWFSASCQLLEPLYHSLVAKVQSSGYLQADETPIAVLTKDKPGSTHKGYLWVYHDPMERLVVFDYQAGRGREGPEKFLKDFSGVLQTDGYAAYNGLRLKGHILQLACMAHARRNFEKALDNDSQRAETALLLIGKLYQIERMAKENHLNHDEIKILRQQQAQPVLEQLHRWLSEQHACVLPKSAIGQAITYMLTLWPRLIRYLDDGRYQMDNNLIENTIRPVALGRKNYLFAGSHEGAKRAAMIYSLLATCKLNEVEPFGWLSHTLEVLPDHPANQLYKLLPIKNPK
ncbi:MAG: IS66 family transposase [Bacteroidetes bacterium]|nr:IS66 family transposase [Bacteroidota bacterium]